MKFLRFVLFATALLSNSLAKPLLLSHDQIRVTQEDGVSADAPMTIFDRIDTESDLSSRAYDHRRYWSKDRDHDDDAQCPAEDPKLPPVEVPPPAITDGIWIWTNEVKPPTAGGVVPTEARPFVKDLQTKCSVDHVTIIMGCDNFCTLYVNGLVVGSEKNGAVTNPQRYTVKFPPTHHVHVAVYSEQDPASKGAIGLIVTGVAWNSNQIKPVEYHFVSDSSWKTFAADDFDMRFIQPGYDVSGWSDALQLGPYGVAPWGSFVVPTTPTAQNLGLTGISGIPDAPVAGPANVITLNGQ